MFTHADIRGGGTTRNYSITVYNIYTVTGIRKNATLVGVMHAFAKHSKAREMVLISASSLELSSHDGLVLAQAMTLSPSLRMGSSILQPTAL